MKVDRDDLVKAATAARENAFAPYSNFKVGAAVKTANGKIYTGCNVENASYGLTVCAERVAIWKAISEREREFMSLAVVADTTELTPPCGACRQIIWELCGNVTVWMANLQGRKEMVQMNLLLPRAFGHDFLEKKQ